MTERITIRAVTETIYLKQLSPKDAARYFSLIAYDSDHLRHFGDTTADKYPDVVSVRDSIAHPKNPEKLRFGIWDNDHMVGTINLTPSVDGEAEIGYWVGKEFVGHGYAARALKLLTGYATEVLHYDVLYCEVAVGNTASARTVKKSGFSHYREYVGDSGLTMNRFMLRRDNPQPLQMSPLR